MKNLDKRIQDARKEFDKFREQENWSEANTRKAYLEAAQVYKNLSHSDDDIETHLNWAKYNLENSIVAEEYGEAAYWRAFISGWTFAETAHRLDVLEPTK